jgi:hypothetical protein
MQASVLASARARLLDTLRTAMQAQGQSTLGEGYHLDALVAAMGPGDYMSSATRASFLTLATQVMRTLHSPRSLLQCIASLSLYCCVPLCQPPLVNTQFCPMLLYVVPSLPRGFSPC